MMPSTINFFRTIVSGPPSKHHTDGDRNFNGSFVKRLYERKGVSLNMTPRYLNLVTFGDFVN